MKALVLASGGLDSAVALFWAAGRYGARNVSVLSFDYAGRPREERKALARLARAAGVRMLPAVSLPVVKSLAGKGRSPGYIPAKNLVFYGIALSLAEREGARIVVGGHSRDDGRAYPDATPAFFGRLERLARAGRFRPRLVMPLIRLTGAGIVRLGRRLAVPLEATWTCRMDGPRPCLRCDACRGRARALREAGFSDSRADR